MTADLKYMGWKLAELAIYVVGFPFLFIGLWAEWASGRCHSRALHYRRPATGLR